MIPSHIPTDITNMGHLITNEKFEAWACKLTPTLPLGKLTINGRFDRYFDPEAQACWEGYCRGIQVAASYQLRLQKRDAQ